MERTEKDILARRGGQVTLGPKTVEVKPLVWDDCNKLEDIVLSAITKVVDVQAIDTKAENAEQLILTSVQTLLREDLAATAMAAVPGLSMDDIRKATKAEVINLCVTAFAINYGYVKNLLDLAATIRK